MNAICVLCSGAPGTVFILNYLEGGMWNGRAEDERRCAENKRKTRGELTSVYLRAYTRLWNADNGVRVISNNSLLSFTVSCKLLRRHKSDVIICYL